MPINGSSNLVLHNLPFKIIYNNFVYLGVCVTNKFGNLRKDNTTSLLTHTKEDFDHWSLIHLTLAARIN